MWTIEFGFGLTLGALLVSTVYQYLIFNGLNNKTREFNNTLEKLRYDIKQLSERSKNE